jgi:hypothetical protein
MAKSELTLMKSWGYFFCGAFFLSGLLAWSVFCVSYIPTNDGPQHILSAYIENHYSDPGSIYSTYLERSPQFAYRGFALIMKPMENMFGWQLGAQFSILIILLLNAWGFTALVLALDSRRKWIAYFGFPLVWSWNMYMGFFSFAVGTGLGYWILAYVLAIKKWDLVRWTTLAGALGLQAMSHVFTAGLTGFLLAFLLVFKQPTWLARGKRLLVVGLVGLPAATIAFGTLLHRNDQLSQGGVSWLTWEESAAIVPHMLIPGPWLNTLPWLILILFAIVAGLWRLIKESLLFEEKVFFGVGLVSLVIAVLGPRDIDGWQFFSQRFAVLGISSLLLILPFEIIRGKKLEFCARLLLVAGPLSSIIVYSNINRNLADSCIDLIETVSSATVREGMSHFIPLSVSCGLPSPSSKRTIPFMRPEAQAGALYAVATGSLTSVMFLDSLALNAFVIRKGSSAPSRKGAYKELGIPALIGVDLLPLAGTETLTNDKPLVYRFAAPGMAEDFDNVFVTGADEANVDLLKGLGFVELWRHGKIWVGRFEPCTIVFEPSDHVPYPPKMNIGLYPYEVSIFIDSIAKVTSSSYEYPHAPCGDVWVQMKPKIPGSFSIYDPKNRPNLKNRVFVSELKEISTDKAN